MHAPDAPEKLLMTWNEKEVINLTIIEGFFLKNEFESQLFLSEYVFLCIIDVPSFKNFQMIDTMPEKAY